MANENKDQKDKDKKTLAALQHEALTLAEKLGQRVDVENVEAMDLEQLTELVNGFKFRLANPTPAAAPAPAAQAAATPVATAVSSGFFVAPGRRSVVCKRGVLGPNEEITARDVGSAEDL